MTISFAVNNHISTFDHDKGELESAHQFIVESMKQYLRAGFLNDITTQAGNQEIVLETFLSDDDFDNYLARISVETPYMSYVNHYLVVVDQDGVVIDLEDLDDVELEEPCEDICDECMYQQDISQAKVFGVFLEINE